MIELLNGTGKIVSAPGETFSRAIFIDKSDRLDGATVNLKVRLVNFYFVILKERS